MNRRKIFILLFVFFLFVLISTFIFFLAIHTKTTLATQAIKELNDRGARITHDGKFYSRGFLLDSMHHISDTFGYQAKLGHSVYDVHLTEEFSNADIILVNSIPHVKTLHLDSSKISNTGILNLHGTDLLMELTITGASCDEAGLEQLSKFKKLKKLTLISLKYIDNYDYAFVSRLNLDLLTLKDITVDPINLSKTLPINTKLSIQNTHSN